MKFTPTRLADVVLIEPLVFEDQRGWFMESWTAAKFSAGGIDAHFVQDNHSTSHQWVLRGLHYQIRHPQGKLVRVVQGEVFDVAVDMRKSSPTYGQWAGESLSAANRRMMWVPPGFAHGFLVTSERAEVLYKCTDYYDAGAERALIWNDSDVGIRWPVGSDCEPILSAKDRTAARFAAAEYFP